MCRFAPGHPDAGRDSFLSDEAVRAQAERHLQLAIQSTIDIALHIISDDTAETPDDYGSAFLLLGRLNVLEPELAGKLKVAAGLRNILVHGYLDVDPARVWGHLDDLDDLERFAAAVLAYIDG
jgi:uncharacterized protein YutE (UPF0331/DUF86 family)